MQNNNIVPWMVILAIVLFMVIIFSSCEEAKTQAELEEINSFVGWEIWNTGRGGEPLRAAMKEAGYEDLGAAWYRYHVPLDKVKIDNGLLIVTGRSGEVYYISGPFYMKELR